MRYFISTLNSSGFVHTYGAKPIFSLQLLSISITKETGESLTLLSDSFNPSQVEGKYLQAILDSGAFASPVKADSLISSVNQLQDAVGLSKSKMKKAIQEFIGVGGYLYGYYPHEDIVLLKSILGDLRGFYLVDLKQFQDSIDTDTSFATEDSAYPIASWWGKNIVPTSLQKSLWQRDLYLFLLDYKERIANQNNVKDVSAL